MSKTQAEEKRDQLVAEANARNANAPDPHITFGEFLEAVALRFCGRNGSGPRPQPRKTVFSII